MQKQAAEVSQLPLTTRIAEVDRLSTSVSITQTYFPPWFSWMLRIIRSPAILWRRLINKAKLKLWCYFISELLAHGCITISNALSSRAADFWVSQNNAMTDALCPNKPFGCPSGIIQNNKPLNTLQTATSYTHWTHKTNILQIIGKASLIIV